MQLEFEISESDYVSACLLTQRCGRGAWVKRFMLPVVYGFCALLLIGLALLMHGMTSFIFVPEIVMLLRGVFGAYFSRRKLVAQYRRNISIQSRNFVEIDERGDRMVDIASERFTPWQDFSGFAENDVTFVRFLGTRGTGHKGAIYITPKRQLTLTQIAEMRYFLQAHLPRRVPGPSRQTLLHLSVYAFIVLPMLWFTAPTLLGYVFSSWVADRHTSHN